jgi:hypothetical protein
MTEIHAVTLASMNRINKIMEYLLDIGAVGIGARRVKDLQIKDKAKDDNTYHIGDDTDTGKSIRDLWYHLMQVQKSEQFDSYPG